VGYLRTLGKQLICAIAATCALSATVIDARAKRRDALADHKTTRTIAFYNIHTKETLRITFKRHGKFVPLAQKKINWFLRDWRRNVEIQIDPKLIDLAWEIHTELGSKKPIHVISGFRSPATNAMLRRTRGGQARRSQHMLGKAMDMHFPDIPVHQLRYSALIRERGGVGYYPTSAIPFVHIDTARVRHWPRMGRQELALLFPSGRTLHRPARGGPITLADARTARYTRPWLQKRVAAFHRHNHGIVTNGNAGGGYRQRRSQRRTFLAAAVPPVLSPFRTETRRAPLVPPVPRLAIQPAALSAPPRLALRPQPRLPNITAIGPRTSDRSRLMQLAALASAGQLFSPELILKRSALNRAYNRQKLLASTQGQLWVRSPAYDEEHPEELSYRPFPIAPLLTITASANDPALSQLVHPDSARTIELLDEAAELPRMRIRPGRQLVGVLWAQAFSGRAIALETMLTAGGERDRGNTVTRSPSPGWNNRRVMSSIR